MKKIYIFTIVAVLILYAPFGLAAMRVEFPNSSPLQLIPEGTAPNIFQNANSNSVDTGGTPVESLNNTVLSQNPIINDSPSSNKNNAIGGYIWVSVILLGIMLVLASIWRWFKKPIVNK